LEGNWGKFEQYLDPDEELKKKYKTNEHVKLKKKSKCRSLLPTPKLDLSENEYEDKVTSFFQSPMMDGLTLLKYDSSCKSESFNDLRNIETDIQIPDFVNVYTGEDSQEGDVNRDTEESFPREIEERVTKNKFKSKKGKIQVSKDLLQRLKSQEDNFSSQTVTSNKKNKRFANAPRKGTKVSEKRGSNKVISKRSKGTGQQKKKVRLETRYKSNQNPSKVDFSKYGSFKGASDQNTNQFKSRTQKLNLKKFMGGKNFKRKNSDKGSQKRTSSALISSDGFNISRKYQHQVSELSMNQSYKKSNYNNSNRRKQSSPELKQKVFEIIPTQKVFEIRQNVENSNEDQDDPIVGEEVDRKEKILKIMNQIKTKKYKNESYEKAKGKLNSKNKKEKHGIKALAQKSKPKINNFKKIKKLKSLKLPVSLIDSSKMTPLNKRKRPPKKNKTRTKPPRLPNKSKTTKNKFYDNELHFDKKKLFKSKMNYIEKQDKAVLQRRITDQNPEMIYDLKRGYTSGGFGNVRMLQSTTSKNFSKRMGLKYDINHAKLGSNKLNLKSRESNLFSNEHNFIVHNSKNSHSKKATKNFNSHQVSKKNNEPVSSENEPSLTSSNFQKKYIINFDNPSKISKSKKINEIPENSFRKNSYLNSEKHNKIKRVGSKMREETKNSKQNNFIKYYPQNISEMSNSKISNSKMKDNFTKNKSKKARKRFKKHIKSVKNTFEKSKNSLNKMNFKSNQSELNLTIEANPSPTSIDLEPFDSVSGKQNYKLEDTNNIYIENFMRNAREGKSKNRKKSSQTFNNINLNPKESTLKNYLNENPQGFSNIYNLKNKKKKSRINNEVNSTKNLHLKKDYSSQSSFYNISKSNFDSKDKIFSFNEKKIKKYY
jgi:hypothetical protein